MTDRHARDEELRKAFQSLADTTRKEPSPADVDLVWRALSEELPASERRALVERMASDPALAETWRAAHELSREAAPSTASAARGRAWAPPFWMTTAAAVLLVGIGIGVTLQLSRSASEDTYRNAAPYVVNSLVPSDATLSRDAFRLRWSPGPQGARYNVRVTTEDLNVLTTVSDLTTAEYVVSPDRLSTLPSGARVFWQVDVVLPEGDTTSSQTFSVKVQ